MAAETDLRAAVYGLEATSRPGQAVLKIKEMRDIAVRLKTWIPTGQLSGRLVVASKKSMQKQMADMSSWPHGALDDPLVLAEIARQFPRGFIPGSPTRGYTGVADVQAEHNSALALGAAVQSALSALMAAELDGLTFEVAFDTILGSPATDALLSACNSTESGIHGPVVL